MAIGSSSSMPSSSTDTVFAGSIPDLYERLLVPMIFEPYAQDLAQRALRLQPQRVLETAAGTGVLTRALAGALPVHCEIVATDLNPAMLDQAMKAGMPRPLEWRVADALQLPFGDASFDLVACQFGAMFFPDRAKGFGEARRVLRPGGHFVFNVWDRIEDNEIADVVTQALAGIYPADPPRFLARVPHGYTDASQIARDLARAGFEGAPQIDTITLRSPAANARDAATAYCQGTPLRSEIEARDPAGLQAATDVAAAAVEARFGGGAFDAKIQARVVCVRNP